MTQQRADYTRDKLKSGGERAERMADTAADRLQDAAHDAQDMAAKVADQARVYGEKAQETVKSFKPYVEKSMKDQPMQTLAVAAIIGFALGALWKK